jgi:hypothetical protein
MSSCISLVPSQTTAVHVSEPAIQTSALHIVFRPRLLPPHSSHNVPDAHLPASTRPATAVHRVRGPFFLGPHVRAAIPGLELRGCKERRLPRSFVFTPSPPFPSTTLKRARRQVLGLGKRRCEYPEDATGSFPVLSQRTKPSLQITRPSMRPRALPSSCPRETFFLL